MTPLIFAAVLFVGLIAINVSFFLCARAIRRDHKKRFDDLQRGLENHATDLVNHLFNANRG